MLQLEHERPTIGGNVVQLILVVETEHGRMFEDVERQLIADVLWENNGHRRKTAEAIGISVRGLGLKLKQYRNQRAVVESSGSFPVVGGATERWPIGADSREK